MKDAIAALALALLFACSAPGPSEPRKSPTEDSGSARPASLHGHWRIVEVNGKAARPQARDPEVQPHVSFASGSYGGSSGCNGFGGHGVLVGERWFAEPPMATQQGCADLTEQENSIFEILASGPTVTWEGADAVVLRAPGGSMRLRLVEAAPIDKPATPPPLLAGTRWELLAVDGAAIQLPGAQVPARLTLEADRWTLETPCATRGGPWRQLDDALIVDPGGMTERPCSQPLLGQSDMVARALAGRLAYVVGPNGELVLASKAHWLTGRQDPTFTRGQEGMFAGEWQIVSVDGSRPPPGDRPPAFFLGPRAFALWDGCRRSEGIAIGSERQLFTLGSGVVTLAKCPRDEVREKISTIVTDSPRIARAGDDEIALIGRSGALRLRRLSTKPFGTSAGTGLRSGTSFDLQRDPGPARLKLGPGDAFTVALPCGTFSGRWRNGRGFGTDHSRFSPERPPAGCGDAPAAMQLYNFFTGNVIAAIGQNRDMALFVNNGRSLPARLVAASP